MASRPLPLTKILSGDLHAAPIAFDRTGQRNADQLLAHAGALAQAIDRVGAGR